MREGNYRYECYLGVYYFKTYHFHYIKDCHGVLRRAFRCYVHTGDGNYVEFETLGKCLEYIRAMSEVEIAKKKLAMLIG